MGSGNSPCASCKLLRRRCAKDCIFAPYFPSDDPHKFAIVHKVFGASNVCKMLQEIPMNQRADAVSSLVYEASARMRDPVYGSVGAIYILQNQVSELQMQLAMAQAEILYIQMQQEPLMPISDSQVEQDLTAYQKSYFLPHQYFNFASSTASSNNVIHDSVKRETIFRHDLVSHVNN